MDKNMDSTLFNLAFTAKEIQLVFRRFATGMSVDVPTEAIGILLAVYYKEDLIQQDIAEIVKKDKSAVLRHIDNLEKKGLVQRVTAANDRRRNVINITDEGKRFIAEINGKANELFSLLSEGLSSIDVRMLNEILNHIQNKAKMI
jgi:DNA-binding MarR family transcriptional regulator